MRAVTQAASTPRIPAASPALRPGSLAPMSILLQVRICPRARMNFIVADDDQNAVWRILSRRVSRGGARRDEVDQNVKKQHFRYQRPPQAQKGPLRRFWGDAFPASLV